MTPLAEAKTISPQVVKKSSNATIDLSTPKPVGFNGGSTEKGVKIETVKPVFSSLGDLEVTSLKTTDIGGKANTKIFAGTDTCGRDCGGTGSCGNTCTCGQGCTACCGASRQQ